MPEVSVIIPNYNHEKHLGKRISSVLNQTFQNFEVIILDDCSTDQSRNVIEPYRNHPKVSHIVYNEENSGSTFKQWKKGTALAKGEFVWIAESDDYASPIFLATLISFIQENKLKIAYTNSYMVDENDKILGVAHAALPDIKPTVDWETDQIFKKGDEMIYYFTQTCMIYNASSAIFHREFINLLNVTTRFKLVGDMAFWMTISIGENVGFICAPLNYFRFHTNNVRTKIFGSLKSEYEHFQLFNHFAKKENTQLSKSVVDSLKIRMTCSFSAALSKRYEVKLVRFMKTMLSFFVTAPWFSSYQLLKKLVR